MLFTLLFTGIALGLAVAFGAGLAGGLTAAVGGALLGQLLGLTDAALVKSFFSSLIFIFFREVDSRNSHWIPKKGPIMFVCAPHGEAPCCLRSARSRPAPRRASPARPQAFVASVDGDRETAARQPAVHF